MNWNEENVSRLKDGIAQGFSASHIAAELGQGATRNAVIGKGHRIGLTFGGDCPQLTPAEAAERRKQRSIVKARAGHMGAVARAETLKQRRIEAAKQREQIAVVPVNDQEIPESQRCSLLELRSDSCRWPIGVPGQPDFFFCNAVALEKQPYCSAHHERATDGQKRPLPWRAAA